MDLLSSPRWKEIDRLFADSLERAPDERSAYLRAAAGGDPDLYRAVSLLLASVDDAEGYLGESASEFVSTLFQEVAAPAPPDAVDDIAAGETVGPYRIISELGRGGMGAVFLAERSDGAFDRRVALKLVKRGMDTDEILRRFHRERHVLASLDHPGVARLLDAGAAADGRPFMVMELVDGEPITVHADRLGLPVHHRLALFRRVCEAVAFAHHRLVVHRDLKPANVMVTRDGTVRLLDFGVAKLLDQDDAWTRPEERFFTPGYAAPEQYTGEAVTTATDVYALGAILYELLAGCRPQGPEPARPSEALGDEAAALRGQSRAHLKRRIQGDLDTITLKALQPLPDRRYPSAEALLDDVSRHLNGLPVRARSDTAAYRIGKFVRRHRTSVVAALAAVSLLTSFAVATALQQRETVRQRDAANQVAAFLEDLFAAADPFSHPTERLDTLRARDLLERGALRVRAELHDQPAVQVRILSAVGGAFERLGLYDQAERALQDALRIGTRALGARHREMDDVRFRLAEAYLGAARYGPADSLFAHVLAVRRARFGRGHPSVGEVLSRQADLHLALGSYDRAEPLYREALDIQLKDDADAHVHVAAARTSLGKLLQARGNLPDAEEQFRLALDAWGQVETPVHLGTAATMIDLASVRQQRGDFVDAEQLLHQARGVLESALGPEHPRVHQALSTLAVFYEDVSRYDDAEAILGDLLVVRRRLLGSMHPLVASSLNDLALVLRNRERYDEAEPLVREALAIQRATLGGEHANVATGLNVLGSILLGRGDLSSAEEAFRESLAMRRRLLGDDHRDTGIGMTHLAELMRKKGAFDEAESLYREAREQAARTAGADHPGVGIITALLANVLADAGRHGEAEVAYRDAVEHMERTLPAGHVRIGRATAGLGASLVAQGRYSEAETALLSAQRVFEAGGHDASTVTEVLASLYAAWQR